MSRNPDVPCAGGCGKMLWRGGADVGERSALVRRCRECRRCPAWQAALKAKPRRRPPRPARTCSTCGAVLPPRRQACDACRTARRAAHFQRKNLRRRAAGTSILTIAELGDRDGWACHLCGRSVDRRLKYPHRRSPSRDHLVPVADGGANDPSNLALAHWICNVRRGTRGVVQLALVG